MKDVEHWKREGFVFEARFPNEYDLWMNRGTMQKLRRYVDGRECLSDSTTGRYRPVQDAPTNGPAPFEVESVAFEGPKTPDQGAMTAEKRLGTNHPLVQIESLLIAATNILYSDIARDSPRRASLDSAIDEALGIVQAWRDDDAGQSGDYDAH